MNLGLIGSNNSAVKEHNRSLVLKLVMNKGPISRSQIALETQLTKTAITDIINELHSYNLIKEIGEGISTGGRKPVLIDINSDAYWIIVIDLSGPLVKAALVNLRAQIKHQVSRSLSLVNQFEVSDLLILINELLKSAVDDGKPILGIGVATPGLLDYENNKVINAIQLGWKDIPLKDEITKYFNLPTYIEREIYIPLLGEQWFGDTQFNNVLYVTIGTGIGAGLMVDGKVYNGNNKFAGEFGHTVVRNNGPLCKCGNRGCIESLASMTAIKEKVKKRFLHGKLDQILTDLVRQSNGQIEIEPILNAVSLGSDAAKNIVTEAAKFLGIGLANLVNLLDPDAIFIGSSIPNNTGYKIYLDIARQTMEERVLQGRKRTPKVILSRFEENARLVGATALVLTKSLQGWLTEG